MFLSEGASMPRTPLPTSCKSTSRTPTFGSAERGLSSRTRYSKSPTVLVPNDHV
jgi:hypothetical protein